MRKLSVRAAVFVFFTLAIVGTLSGVEPFVCGIRAVAGALVILIIFSIAGRMLVNIMVDTIFRHPGRSKNREDHIGESTGQ